MIQMTIFYHNRTLTICRQLEWQISVWLENYQNFEIWFLLTVQWNQANPIDSHLQVPRNKYLHNILQMIVWKHLFSIRASWCQQWRPWAWLGTFSPSECSDPPTLIWRWILWRFLRKLQLFFSSFLKSCDVTVIYWDSWELCKLIFC